MDKHADRSITFDLIWIVAVGLASSAAIVVGASRLSATFDEPTYIANGLQCWRTGSYKSLMRLGTMPLAIDVQTLPLYVVERWRGRPFDAVADFDAILPYARAATLIFYWVLLVYGMLIARRLGGPWAGRVAVMMLAVEPTVFAHAGLATTDIAVAAMLLAFGYHFAAGRTARWPLRIALPGGLYALAILAKASGLVFAPILMLVIELQRHLPTSPAAKAGAREEAIRRTSSSGRRFSSVVEVWRLARPFRIDAAWILLIGLVLTFVYIGSDWQAEITFVRWADSLPSGRFQDAMVWLTNHVRVFTNAGEGIVQQIKHNLRGHGAYLLGGTWKRSVWYYFPVALSMKLSIALMGAVVFALMRPRTLWQWPALAAGALLLFSLNTKVQIGVRMLMPLIAVAIVAASIALARWRASLITSSRRAAFTAVVLGGIGWNVLDSIAVWPNSLTYVNRLWGGPEAGYALLSDSNYDWGQGLPELERWMKRNRRSSLAIWYFGADPSVLQPPFQLLPIHTTPDASPEQVACQTGDGWIAIGATILHGAYIKNVRFLDYVRTQTPVARTSTFFIYQLPTPSPTAMTRRDEPVEVHRR